MRFVFLWDTWAAVASILLVFGKGVFFKVDTGATDKVIVYKSCGEHNNQRNLDRRSETY